MRQSFILKGDICYSKSPTHLEYLTGGRIVCENGLTAGVFAELPERFSGLPLIDYGNALIIPGLVDLHIHAPQYAFRGLGMDLELLDWLNSRAFPEEAKYADEAYADRAYSLFVKELRKGPNTRACIFATRHAAATELLMDKLEASGLVSLVGKVNMDRNSHPGLQETCADESAADTVRWLENISGRHTNTLPILTPRFIPSCSDELMQRLRDIQRQFRLPVQSHLSENPSENAWVRELCPNAASYADAYRQCGLFGEDVPTVMAHCVWVSDEEIDMMRDNRVFVAHCPQSNMNLSSGIAPARRFLDKGVPMGLGSDVAGGCHTSIFRAMSDAVQASKLRWRLVDQAEAPLTMEEAFYLATTGGQAFFEQAGTDRGGFEPGDAFDALVIDDNTLAAPFALDIPERLARVVYFSDDRHIRAKYVRGATLFTDMEPAI